MKKFYIYKTTNIITHKFYIGMHRTDNMNDGYLGSGVILKRSLKKYGKENHIKEILSYHESFIDLCKAEQLIINEEMLKKPLSMNIRLGGRGGWTKDDNKKSQLAQQKLRCDPVWVENKRNKLSILTKKLFDCGKRKRYYFYDWNGKKHTEETKKKLSSVKSGKCTYGDNYNAKKVIDANGKIFTSIKECSEYYNVHPETISNWIKKGKIFKL